VAANADDILHPEARLELRGEVERSRGYGGNAISFVAEVNRVILELMEAPQRWPVLLNVKPLTRYRVMPKKFPFTIFYRETATSILVLAIAHQKREPLYWVHRR